METISNYERAMACDRARAEIKAMALLEETRKAHELESTYNLNEARAIAIDEVRRGIDGVDNIDSDCTVIDSSDIVVLPAKSKMTYTCTRHKHKKALFPKYCRVVGLVALSVMGANGMVSLSEYMLNEFSPTFNRVLTFFGNHFSEFVVSVTTLGIIALIVDFVASERRQRRTLNIFDFFKAKMSRFSR